MSSLPASMSLRSQAAFSCTYGHHLKHRLYPVEAGNTPYCQSGLHQDFQGQASWPTTNKSNKKLHFFDKSAYNPQISSIINDKPHMEIVSMETAQAKTATASR